MSEKKRVNPVRNIKEVTNSSKISNGVKVRRFWQINPKTRILESKKRYMRAKIKKELAKLIEDAKSQISKNRST